MAIENNKIFYFLVIVLFFSFINTFMMHINVRKDIHVSWKYKFNPMNIIFVPEYLTKKGKKFWYFQLFIIFLILFVTILITIIKLSRSL